MPCPELLHTIDELYDRYVDIWEDLCELESPTDDKAGVDAAGRYIIRWAETLGFAVEVEPMEGAGDPICITMNPSADAAVVFSGHIDTVHPVGLFGTPAVHRDDTHIYGPGVLDCKGGVVASMLAMEALKQCGFTARPVKLIIQTDEETGSKNSGKRTIDFMVKRSKGAAAFLNTEGCTGYQTVLTRKGIARFRFNVHGRAVHSAVCPRGANAVAEAAHKLLKLEELKDTDGLTCNCGVISGGTVANTVAAECTFLADFRFAIPEQYDYLLRLVTEVAEHSTVDGCTCNVEAVSYRPAMPLTDNNLALFERLNALYAENGMPQLKRRHSPGGSDAAYTTEAGIPTIDGMGVDGDHSHSVKERAVLTTLAEAAKRLAVAAWGI